MSCLKHCQHLFSIHLPLKTKTNSHSCGKAFSRLSQYPTRIPKLPGSLPPAGLQDFSRVPLPSDIQKLNYIVHDQLVDKLKASVQKDLNWHYYTFTNRLINPNKIQGTACQVSFLGNMWLNLQHLLPLVVKKIVSGPLLLKEASAPYEFFVCYSQHVSHWGFYLVFHIS